jgi:hypothetical protein
MGNQNPQRITYTNVAQKEKGKRTSKDLQNTTQKTKNRATRTPQKT